MRKELNSKSKRKWVVGGVAFFGAIALLTTGFATWVVGTTITNDDEAITIAVDTVTNESVRFSVELTDSTIALREANSEGALVSIKDNADGTDFSIAGKATILRGTSYTLPAAINVTHDALAGTIAAEDPFGRTAGSANYIELVDTSTSISTSGDDVQDGTLLKREIPFALTFKWSAFFNDKAPSVFYNDYYSSLDEDTQKSRQTQLVNQVENDLTAMHEAWDGKTLTLTFALGIEVDL